MLLMTAVTSSCKQPNEPSNRVALNESMMTNEPVNCQLLTDFTNAIDYEKWRTVNDNVMGGKSIGGMQFKDDTMIFSGFINTHGGGFSSIRYHLNEGQIVPFETLKLRVRSTNYDLNYRVIFEDEQRSSVFYGSPIKLEKTEEWQEITLQLADFQPYRRGNKLSRPVFKKETAYEIGFIVSHSSDSNFKIEVDWMKLCK